MGYHAQDIEVYSKWMCKAAVRNPDLLRHRNKQQNPENPGTAADRDAQQRDTCQPAKLCHQKGRFSNTPSATVLSDNAGNELPEMNHTKLAAAKGM
eukprot:CAMPEP_0172917520 /NCGR_PEP_ID=MMETSP1075-20121228/198507_2 /TAXON_ID=2916 /ORGANISM="Ceratium fusus, Strain PA161109" /LENGTH=95 /DNA_ID=CAMNT_0013777011 /DNA_START=653 /DNA_END=941 /DNA_ORIENTATION=-